MANKIDNRLPVLAIVVPCYNEEDVIKHTLVELQNALYVLKSNSLIDKGSYIYCVDDGSTDNTWEIITEKHTRDNIIKGLKLSINVGHQNTVFAGLMCVKDNIDCAISIDADLQDDITVISEMVAKFNEGYDVVYGVRRDRSSDSFFKRFSAHYFYHIIRFLGVKCVYNHSDFRLLSKRCINALSLFREVNIFLRGIIPTIGFKSTYVEYDRKPRQAGKTKYPLKKMISFAWEGITSFSVVPLRLITLSGIIVFMLSLILSIWVFFNKIIGNVIPGWASIVLPIYIISGILMFSLGIIGEYLGKIYKEIKARPRFIKDKELL